MTPPRKGPRLSVRGDQMAKEYRKGLTMREIAAKHGVSKAAVSKAIARRGCSPSFEEWHRRTTARHRKTATARERRTRKGKSE